MLLEKVWWKIQFSRKTTFSSLKINDFRTDFEERTFLKFWSKKFEICSNSIFCSQILHGMLLARAITPKARQNSCFEKCFRILCFFLKIEFSIRYFEHVIWSWKETLTEVNKSWTFQNYKKWHGMSILEKTPNYFFSVNLSTWASKASINSKIQVQNFFSNFWGRKSYQSRRRG